ncbi:epimerase, partial [Arthrobacter sp. HMWF013]
YVPDLAAAMILAARTPALWNRVWHAPTGPALTQRQLASAFTGAAEVRAPRIGTMPGWVFRATEMFSQDMRELAETLYQFEKPFVMDSAESQAALGLRPTPLPEAAAATVKWWQAQG